MAATTYGDQARIVLCQTVTAGTEHTTTYTDSGTVVFIKCEEPEIDISFDSKIKYTSGGKSRITPDLKYKQSFTCQDGILLTANVNGVKEWLMDRYIAKSAINLLAAIPLATGTPEAYPDGTGTNIHLLSWYNSSQSKVWYLKGFLEKLKIKLSKGRVYRISFKFVECWSP